MPKKIPSVKLWLISLFTIIVTVVVIMPVVNAQDEDLPKGVGPVEQLELSEEIDAALAAEGQGIYEQFCTACHKLDERYVGPAILGVTERRSPEWIMNMIINPDVMIMEDDTAYNLFAEYMTPMANQGITEEQSRAILEHFRLLDAEASQ